MISSGRRRRLYAIALLLLAAGGGRFVLSRPATTLQAVNGTVTAYQLPAYVKLTDFFQRHFQYEVLATRICGADPAAVDCTLSLLDWTHTNIPPTPGGWPVVDDHPLHIVIRGHGERDQIADVFSTLAVYAGVPAFFQFVTDAEKREMLPVTFVYLDGKWTVFDVAAHVAFRDRAGQLASIEQLADDPALVDGQADVARRDGLPYSAFISRERLMPFVVPQTLRPQLQQPWPRVRYELRRALGWEREPGR